MALKPCYFRTFSKKTAKKLFFFRTYELSLTFVSNKKIFVNGIVKSKSN